ncbi:MAG TPA: glycoside hydrolase family 2 protein, partial [Armatimonadota bacterium]
AAPIELRREGQEVVLSSSAFAWGVCLDLDGELPLRDNCFDLLPGVPYRLPWPSELGQPAIQAAGSSLVARANVPCDL